MSERDFQICKALASTTRRTLLTLISQEDYNVHQLAELLDQSEANISSQLTILQKAGLVKAYYTIGRHGISKLCKIISQEIIIDLNGSEAK